MIPEMTVDEICKRLAEFRKEGNTDDLEYMMGDTVLQLATLLRNSEIGMELFSYEIQKLLKAAGWGG